MRVQILELCKYVISELTPYFCAAVQDKRLRADLALSAMSDLLHYLVVANCDDSSERSRLNQETRRSDKWVKLAGQLARLADFQSDKERPSKLAPAEFEAKGAMAEPGPVASSRNGRDTVAAERAELLRAYKEEGKKRGIQITDEMIAITANPGRWNERTPVQRWKRNYRCTPGDDARIRAVLKDKPHLR